MQYMGGKSRIARSIASIINEVPRWKITNSNTVGTDPPISGGLALLAFSAGAAPLRAKYRYRPEPLCMRIHRMQTPPAITAKNSIVQSFGRQCGCLPKPGTPFT